ncbi:MAG: hypothetical protein AAGA58_06350 [Verrucomicrobiota bacterium]
MTEPNKPIHVFRAGQVKASVWLNRTEGGDPYFSTSVVRSYFDEGDKKWKDTVSFGRDDLPKVRLVSDLAYQFIFLKSQEISKEGEQENSFVEKEKTRRASKTAGKAA